MEPCEKDYILQNLSYLTSNTLCNFQTLIILVEKGVITNEEYQFLSAKNLNHGSMAAVMELYQIAITRLNGYNLLIDALYKSGQTGAVGLLLDAPFGVNPPVQLLESQAKLLQDFEVQIFDDKRSFKEMFPNLSTQQLTEILSDLSVNNEFRKLERTSEKLLIVQAYTPHIRPFYIPRSISNRLLLNKQLFQYTQKEVEDVFVFTGFLWKDLAELIKPHLLQSSTSQLWSITCRHIFLDHPDDWNKILQTAKSPVHLINFDGENYVLQSSNRATNILLEYSYRGDEQKHPYVTEDEFIGQISTERNGMLLCDVPGMGKTWLMESLAKKIQRCSTDRIVFFIALPLLSNHLEAKQWDTNCNNSLAMVLEYTCKSELVTSVLCASGENKPMLVFVCDGFDEIMECIIEKTLAFLKDLRSKPNVKLLITSRPHKRKYLETNFELASFDILPLRSEEQIGFLVQHWQGKLGSDEQNVPLEEFASQCFRSLRILKGDPISKLLGTPLICSLMAVINEENANRLSASNPNRPLVVPQNVIVNSISELYEMFVKFCLKKLPEDQQENIIDYHVYHALKLLFPDLSDAYIRAKELMMCDLIVLRVGIMSQSGEFLHRSFAEYFVGKLFAQVYQNTSGLDGEFVSLVGSKFVNEFLRGSYKKLTAVDDDYIFNNYQFSRFAVGLQNLIVLYFMNGECNINEQALSLRREEMSQSHLKMLKSLIGSSINEFLFVTILLNLEKLLSFYVSLIKILFTNDEERIAFVTGETPLKTYSTLLCFAARYGRPAAVNLLFTLYQKPEGNWLASKFKHYYPSDNEESPLEIAIKRNDIDLVECFYGKVFMTTERLHEACFTVENAENDNQILKIMDRVLPAGNEVCRMTQDRMYKEDHHETWLKSDIPTCCILCRLLIKFAYMRRTSLISLDKITKATTTSHNLKIGNDKLFIKTLLLLFHKDALVKRNGTFETGINSDQHLTELPADQILSLLDITAVKETFPDAYVRNNYNFANITRLETLKVLLAIRPSFTNYNDYKRNYMHLAVHQDKMDWVAYLIQLGHDVNQQDADGKTPLLSVSTKTEPAIVTCLVQNGADIYIVDNNGGNFLHCLLSSETTKDFFPSHFISTWINFIFKNKFNKLLERKNSDGLTPISLLAQKYNEEADLVFSMYGECQFMPQEVKAALLERNILWSNDVKLIKLLAKMFPVGENPYDSKTDHLRLMNHSDALLAFNSDSLLQLIDITEAKKMAQNVLISKLIQIKQPFQYIKNTETLKVLLKIIPDFSCRNVNKLNYMHISVAQGKVEWLKHLIALGHDVNKQDKWGNTPVFYLSEKNTMVLTRLLGEKRANLGHINCKNETFAHYFLKEDIPKDLVIEWTRYLLEIGAHNIWHIPERNSWRLHTPFELLSRRLGKDHPATGEVLAAAPNSSDDLLRILINTN